MCVREREREKKRDGQRKNRSSEKTQHNDPDSPIRVIGIPMSSAEMAIHFPVPFCPAKSLIFSTNGCWSVSLKAMILAVISMRKESSSPLFHSVKTWRERVGWSEKEGGGRGGVSGREGRGWEGGRE